MPHYLTERRKTYETNYLKVQLKDNEKLEIVQKLLKELQSVKNANITDNKRADLTVYHDKFFDINELEEEVILQLDSFFESKPLDPCFKQENLSEISEEAYVQIIKEINKFGKNLEKYEGLYSKFDEEGFREFFLPHMNSISSSYSATGETFNKKGKTDILIQNDKGENVFIGECKIWHGESEFLKAIDQLLERYVTWRDEYISLIVFNKHNSDFSKVIESAKEAIKKHPRFDSFIKENSITSISYLFKNAEDPSKKVKLELILFNCK